MKPSTASWLALALIWKGCVPSLRCWPSAAMIRWEDLILLRLKQAFIIAASGAFLQLFLSGQRPEPQKKKVWLYVVSWHWSYIPPRLSLSSTLEYLSSCFVFRIYNESSGLILVTNHRNVKFELVINWNLKWSFLLNLLYTYIHLLTFPVLQA